MDKTFALVATIAVGGMITLQAPLNAQLAKTTSVLGAAFLTIAISCVVLFLLVLTAGELGNLGGARELPWYYLSGGLMGGTLVVVTLSSVRALGAAGLIACLLTGQLSVALVLDSIGFVGLREVGVTPIRLLGVGLLVAGTVLIVRP